MAGKRRIIESVFIDSAGVITHQFNDADTLEVINYQDIPVEAKICCDCGCDGSSGTQTLFEDGGGVKYYVDSTNQKVFFALGDEFSANMPLAHESQNIPADQRRWIFPFNSKNSQINGFGYFMSGSSSESWVFGSPDTSEVSGIIEYNTYGANETPTSFGKHIFNPITDSYLTNRTLLYYHNTPADASLALTSQALDADNNPVSAARLARSTNWIQIEDRGKIWYSEFQQGRDDGQPTSMAWFDDKGYLQRTDIANVNLGAKNIPMPLISTVYHKELQHVKSNSITSFSLSNINVMGNAPNPSIPTVIFDGDADPNNSVVTFAPNYPLQKGVLYREKNNINNSWKYDGLQYIVHDNQFSFDDLVNQGVIWLGARAESGQDINFFLQNTPMLLVEIYGKGRKKNSTHNTSNDGHRWKKWQSWNFDTQTFENLNRPLNTKETGSTGLDLLGNGNGCQFFASQWNFEPTGANSEQLIRLDVHALFGNKKSSNTPDFQFPIETTTVFSNVKEFSPRYLYNKGISFGGVRAKTSFQQPIRFRFACLDPNDNRNLLYSEPSQVYLLGMKGGYFANQDDNYMYQFSIRKGM